MSVTVDQGWVIRFHDQIKLTYQTTEALLENRIHPGMVHRDISAAIDHHDRMGLVIARDVVDPFGAMTIDNPAHTRRAVTMQSSKGTVLVSDEHTLRSMTNPQSSYMQTIVGSLQRRKTKHIIDAATGSATTASVTTGSGIVTYGSQILLSAHMIGGATALDKARIDNANELLSKAGVPPGQDRTFAYGPGQLRDILAITQATSSDFYRGEVIRDGTINGKFWAGFTFVEIPDVFNPDLTTAQAMLALSGTTRTCFAFHNTAIGVSSGRDIQSDIGPRRDLAGLPTQVDARLMQAAVRVWEAGVVQVDALEN